MPQLLLQGFPDGAIRIGSTVSVLKKADRVTYFVGSDNYFSHAFDDESGSRFAIATLIINGHVRACDVEQSEIGIAHRTLMHWTRQLSEHGPGSFYRPRKVRSGHVFTDEKVAECEKLLTEGATAASAARVAQVGESALRKAISSGRVRKSVPSISSNASADSFDTSKSDRSRLDARASEGMGTACTRADERIAAAFGLIKGATTRFEHCLDVQMGGLLTGLPALCANGLLSGLGRHLSLRRTGFYEAMHILLVLGFMALARIRRPEGLRHVPPGELGKVVGLDRVPEVKTLRRKVARMANDGDPRAWMQDLSRAWMSSDPHEAGYLYVDGHVRVYHGTQANLPRRYVSREKLCLRGTTDYWVSDALGRPFFVVSQPLTDGMAQTLIDEIVPELIKSVPLQPSEEELAANPLLHRFVIICDREGATNRLFSKLWEQRIGVISYRKNVKDVWPESEFSTVEVAVPGGGNTKMSLASRQTKMGVSASSLPVLEVRRLSQTGHQTAIISSAMLLENPVVAGRMFSRWCQENFFGYMMQHYDFDGLVQYGAEDIPGTLQVINPARRELERLISHNRRRIRKLHAELGAESLKNDGGDIQARAEMVQDIQQLQSDTHRLREQRRDTPRKVPIESLPEELRPRQLMPLTKMLSDTVKMIAYRAETAVVGLLKPHLAKDEEARALARELFVSSADLVPDEQDNTLTVRVHRMASPSHDKAVRALFNELNMLDFQHPQTNAKLIYELA